MNTAFAKVVEWSNTTVCKTVALTATQVRILALAQYQDEKLAWSKATGCPEQSEENPRLGQKLSQKRFEKFDVAGNDRIPASV